MIYATSVGTSATEPTQWESICSYITGSWSELFPISDPTWIFFWVLCIILFDPLLFNKLRLPHIIGMILAGLVIGPNGLNILSRDDSFELFGKVL